MNTEKIVKDAEIKEQLRDWRWDGVSAEEGRLMLAELLLKAGAGCYNSHTEEGFLMGFGLLKKDRTPNKRGRKFLCSMLYNHSNTKPEYFHLMQKTRR